MLSEKIIFFITNEFQMCPSSWKDNPNAACQLKKNYIYKVHKALQEYMQISKELAILLEKERNTIEEVVKENNDK